MAFTGNKTLQIAGEGALTIEATTIAGNLTVQLTGPDGEVLLDETTDTDAVWQLDAPNAVQLTVIGKEAQRRSESAVCRAVNLFTFTQN